METTQNAVERYIQFVEETIDRFKGIGEITSQGQVSYIMVNTSLADYWRYSDMISAEYQRVKIQNAGDEIDYQLWYDEKFLEAKQKVIDDYGTERGSIKPSLKEFEVRMRQDNKEEWKEWQLRLKEGESKTRFMMRMRDKLARYDSILTTLSTNSRSEMRNLTIMDRANSGGGPRAEVDRFPTQEEVEINRKVRERVRKKVL
jgi:hypothetical protein